MWKGTRLGKKVILILQNGCRGECQRGVGNWFQSNQNTHTHTQFHYRKTGGI